MNNSFIFSVALFLSTSTMFGQDLSQSQVPSVVVNKFQQAFPKAFDVEWEKKGELYKVEFETGLSGIDHDAWYDNTGKLVKHQQAITKSELPQKVKAAIDSNFSGYRADDVKKITEGKNTIYKVELKSLSEEWKVVFDSNGKVVSKIAD